MFAFAAGSQHTYDYINNNPEVMAAPVDYTNDVRVMAQIDNFISINNCVSFNQCYVVRGNDQITDPRPAYVAPAQ